ERSGIADDRTHQSAGEANNRGGVTRLDADQRRAQSQTIAEFADSARRKKMRPGYTQILLLVVLFGRLADNNVLVVEDLPRVLPTSENVIGLPRIPINPPGIIVQRTVESNLSNEGVVARSQLVWHRVCRKASDDRFDQGA